MTYESANSIRQRCYYDGKYPQFFGNSLRGMINRTLTLREDSDIVARHGLVQRRLSPMSDEQMKNVYSQVPRRPASHFLKEYHPTKKQSALPAPVVWFVSHCNDFNGRFKYVNWLRKFIKVDIYGECGTKSCGFSRNMGHSYSLHRDPCFDIVNRNYRFYISFENAICKDYVTEKIFNSLQLNTIPLILGGANYTKILPPNSFINVGDFDNPENLAEFLYDLLRNETRYLSYFEWRPHYDIHSYMSVPDNCDLCEKLSSGGLREEKTYDDMFSWLVRDADCVYTSPRWKLRKYLSIWREAAERSH